MSRDLTLFLRAQQRALLRRCADQVADQVTDLVAAAGSSTPTRFDIVMRQLELEQKESRRRCQASAYMREWRANQSAKAVRKETKQ